MDCQRPECALPPCCPQAPRSGWGVGAAHRLLAVLLLVAVGAGCETPPSQAEREVAVTDPVAQVVRSPHGVVVSAEPLATEVGARVLAQGGNAMDAAVATGFALSVVEFSMSGLAGRASVAVRLPDGSYYGIDGLNTVPETFQEEEGAEDYERAAVPGMMAALARGLEEHGSWSLAQVLEPAIRFARDGFPLPPSEAARLESAVDDLSRHPGSSALFLDEGGTPPEAGATFRNPELARVLESVAQDGVQVFYQGWIADSIHADMERSGGFVTREDLAAYEALPAIPVVGEYRGFRIHSNFRPASGHAVIQALQTLEEVPGTDLENEVEWAAVIGQAMHHALADRRMEVGTEEESAQHLTSREHAQERAAEILVPGPAFAAASSDPGSGTCVELKTHHTDVELGPNHTTHVSAVDESGMAVALTQSLGPSLGTRVVSPGLGFLYATRLSAEPGSRPSSTISPTVVTDPNGELAYVTGSAGDARIVSSVIQVLSRLIDHQLSLEEAVAAPRLHPSSAEGFSLEQGEESVLVPAAGDGIQWPAQVVEGLEALGFAVEGDRSGNFGRPQSVAFDPDEGLFTGVSEPRRWGGAAAPVQGRDGGP